MIVGETASGKGAGRGVSLACGEGHGVHLGRGKESVQVCMGGVKVESEE